ncbi:hypothetical protein CRG98_012673 [Punica granatum]|uniref:Peptidase A1 domain-containing protein n=1 Tax=Punica granatum TaxID=22663 RepID=A0A2I0KF62_PUNGR|nr:hypothetical protein CRG98_012673 [Punica granatum]
MDPRPFLAVATLLVLSASAASGNVAFQVHSKLKGRERSLSALREHDSRRHGRLLSAVDFHLGGNGNPSDTGLYYAKIGLGSPSKDYYVQVDTGSDILWVSCAGCDRCPTKSSLGIKLEAYDPKSSSTASTVKCDQEYCIYANNGELPGCKSDLLCQYNVVYGDGSSTTGYYVKDQMRLDRVTGNLQSSWTNASVIFGCANKQSGDLGSGEDSAALSGLMGFGQSNTSVLSQLASAGKVKKIFAHCLDSKQGGGIFTIGEVVEPKVKTTALVPNQSHYNVVMKAIEVGGEAIQLGTGILGLFDDEKHAIIDSGTTLILAKQSGLKLHTVDEQFTCFEFSEDVDDGFPAVKFQFAGSLDLTAYPHDYLFPISDNKWCFGWMSSSMQSKGKDVILLGDLVLSNKLVVYDLVNQTVGWVDFNCSSSIKVKDEESGATYAVGAHDLSSRAAQVVGRTFTWLLLIPAILYSLPS